MLSKNKNKKEDPIQVNDSDINQKDSVVALVQHIAEGMQKFILEISNSQRAFERYGQLKTFLWDVQMETKDSVNYKLDWIIS